MVHFKCLYLKVNDGPVRRLLYPFDILSRMFRENRKGHPAYKPGFALNDTISGFRLGHNNEFAKLMTEMWFLMTILRITSII